MYHALVSQVSQSNEGGQAKPEDEAQDEDDNKPEVRWRDLLPLRLNAYDCPRLPAAAYNCVLLRRDCVRVRAAPFDCVRLRATPCSSVQLRFVVDLFS